MTTYKVSVQRKATGKSCHSGGINVAYSIDGEVCKELHVTSGQTYTFEVDKTGEGHGFYFTTDQTGGHGNGDIDGDPKSLMNGKPPVHEGTFQFTIPTNIHQFYYQCSIHPYMGGKVIVEKPSHMDTNTYYYN